MILHKIPYKKRRMETNEVRSIQSQMTADESRTVYGRAVIFESESNDMGWIETIKRGAIT